MNILIPISLVLKEWTVPLLLCGLIFGEARGESDLAKVGVASVVLNRVQRGGWFGKTHKEVILKRKQFSCYNKWDPNFRKIMNPLKYENLGVWEECWRMAEGVLKGELLDPTDGACWYYSGTKQPRWAKTLKFTVQIGDLKFYK